MRIAACQMNSRQDKTTNLATVLALLDQAAEAGADLAVLPEYLDYLGTDDGALHAAEPVPGPFIGSLAARARILGLWVLAGSVHARGPDGRCRNASLLLDRQGRIAARYDKLHLFDIGLPGQPSCRESATVGGGDRVLTAEIDGVLAGLSICYDLRFPELYRLHALAGAQLLLVPAAFTLHTGRAHWELLLRARAVENQCFVIAAGQVGESLPGRECFGHSMIVDPWGYDPGLPAGRHRHRRGRAGLRRAAPAPGGTARPRQPPRRCLRAADARPWPSVVTAPAKAPERCRARRVKGRQQAPRRPPAPPSPPARRLRP